MNETTSSSNNDSVASMRYLNVTAIKQHALKCSQELRAGKFDRVSQSFIDDVQAETERLVREINSKYQPPVHAIVDSAEACFVTGAFVDKTREVLDAVVARIVQAKVQRHPSVGQTLK